MRPAGELLFGPPSTNKGSSRWKGNDERPAPKNDADPYCLTIGWQLLAALVHGQSADRELAVPSKFAQVADR